MASWVWTICEMFPTGHRLPAESIWASSLLSYVDVDEEMLMPFLSTWQPASKKTEKLNGLNSV